MSARKGYEDCFQPAMTFQEIADVLGCTAANVQIHYKKAMRKLLAHADHADAKDILAMIERRRCYAEPTGRKGVMP